MNKDKIQAAESTPTLRCDNILVSSRGLTETEGKKVILFVPSSEVDHIILRFGRADHNPIVSFGLGAIFSLMGVFGLVELVLAPAGLRYEVGLVAFGLVGGLLIFDALKKRYFLEVHKKKGISRLVFSKQASLNDIRDFCNKVAAFYKYKITEEV